MLKCDFKKYVCESLVLKTSDFSDKITSISSEFKSGNLSYWTNENSFVSEEELGRIKEVSAYIRNNCDVFIVIGIGGSYMGSKAVIEALKSSFNRKKPEIIYLGIDLSSDYYNEVVDYIKDKEVIVNVISKSGNTLEPSIAFDVIMDVLNSKYSSEELKKRVIVTTDKETGSLRSLVQKEGFTSFEVPKKIGGRFSVFTPVGLIPIAVSGIDIDKLLEGFMSGLEYNDEAFLYAALRQILYNEGKFIESFTIYNPKLTYFTEWLKQLFAETEGKDNKGVLPISNVNTRDLHSMGQFLQEGHSIIFETVIKIDKAKDMKLNKHNKTLNEINNLALEKVCVAHEKGNTPSIVIKVDELNEYTVGEMVRFFITSAIAGALLTDVNPFDQPGVETYKKLIEEGLK